MSVTGWEPGVSVERVSGPPVVAAGADHSTSGRGMTESPDSSAERASGPPVRPAAGEVVRPRGSGQAGGFGVEATAPAPGADTERVSGPPASRAAALAVDPAAEPLAAVLAVDAGNSKTDVALVADDGTVLGEARGGGFQPTRTGTAAAVDALAEAVAAATGGRRVRHVSACLANADLPVEVEQLEAALAERGWGDSVTVRNDTFAILRAGVDVPRGVAVVCGSGINCVGLLPDGRTHRFPALGAISGDWGGGGGLADEALWHAARAEDGRGEATALAAAVPAHFGLRTVYDLIEGLHLGRIPPRRVHELSPVLFAVAADGDAVARSLVDRQADEVVTMAVVALGRLALLDEETPVVLGGSVLAARHAQLDDGIRDRLASRAPKAVPRVVTAPPVLGAALLGLDAVGRDADAAARVRAHYA